MSGNVHTYLSNWLLLVFPAMPQGDSVFSYLVLLLVTFLTYLNSQYRGLQVSCDTNTNISMLKLNMCDREL